MNMNALHRPGAIALTTTRRWGGYMNGDAKAWLVEHDIELDPAATKRFANVWRDVAGVDDHIRDTALLAAARYLAGEATPASVGKTLARARSRVAAQWVAAKVVAKLAVGDGAAEAATAREVGVDRMALRRWLGKR